VIKTEKNILTIAPLLAGNFIELDDSIFDINKYSEFLKQNNNRLGDFNKYLICKLHDSWIIDVLQQNDKLVITLNDFSTHVFADAIIDRFKLHIDSNNISFPVRIEFIDNLSIDYYNVNNNGKLDRIEPVELNEYLFEQITDITDDKIDIAFHFWRSNLKEDKPGESIIVVASSKYIKVTENQEKAWKEIIGDVYNDFYSYFSEQYISNRYVSDFHECIKLIEEFEQRLK
jgi:hypothetical protein